MNKNYDFSAKTTNNKIYSVGYEDDENDNDNDDQLFYKTSILLNLINMFVLGTGLTLFVIGILFLSVYRYEYSFTVFSIDMMAGLFLASGSIMFLYSIVSVFLIKPYEKPHRVVIYSLVVFVMFLLLFLLGVIGLSMNGNGEFSDQIQIDMQTTGLGYDLNDPFSYETLKMNWLQRKFKCCESCCVTKHSMCQKMNTVNGLINHSQGCFHVYEQQFSKDIIFLCTFSLVTSIVLLLLTALMILSSRMIAKNYQVLFRIS